MSLGKKTVAIEISIKQIIKKYFPSVNCDVITYSIDYYISHDANSTQYNNNYECKIIFDDDFIIIDTNKIIPVDADIYFCNILSINEPIKIGTHEINNLSLRDETKKYIKQNLNEKYDRDIFITMIEKIFCYICEVINDVTNS
jgi:hypothetical protein